jgi:hypothetical protein
MTKGHTVQCPPSHPIFLFFKNDTHNFVGQPKGTSSKEVKICALEGKSFPQQSTSPPRAESWLSSTFDCPLKEDLHSTSFSCHV